MAMSDADIRDEFTISQLAAAFEVTPRAIRFYEDKGLLSPARRGQARVYSRRDRVRLALILRGKRVGFSLGEIKELLDLYDLKDGQETQLRVARGRFEERIAALEAQRRDIDESLSELRAAIAMVDTQLDDKARREDRAQGLVGYAVVPSDP